ncbi:sporulation protein YpjB [Sporolactobacillus inulinus]|uniref:Sporulation protein n=1 Tax=Sporolactobacillus inulinus CASD TaxID=1069536 RepID=A0A0U1QLI3_9BACL|nr:sporulation protein YpjB [Sporolactobacillus inulinus]KLI01667.1 hypothetical protein SINU_12325 [Sporolactobacillus inulinus CASD]GEB76139.1 hypothetical protein SIN01_04840 [Sporolactobacillus inulinus]
MNVKLFIIFVCFTLFIGFPERGYAENSSAAMKNQTDNLVSLSDQVFHYSIAKQDKAAASLLHELSEKWNHSLDLYSEKEQQVIGTSIVKLKVLLKTQANQQEIADAAASLRLGFDALQNEGAPMWKEKRSDIMEPLSRMNTALKNKKQEHYQYELNQFLNEYAIIYPALIIDGRPDMVTLLDQRITTLTNHRLEDIKESKRISQVNRITDDMNRLFKQSRNGKDENTMGLMTIIGGIVVAVLAYVSWVRYTAERKRRSRIH